MKTPISVLLKEQIYPALNAVDAGLLTELNPRLSGKAYILDCPVCQKPKKAFYYPGGSHITCNRRNSCGVSLSIWDYLAEHRGLSNREVLQVLADAAGIPLEASAASSEEKDREKVKSALRYGLEKSTRAREYMRSRGWSDEEMDRAPIGYIHKFEYFMNGLERLGVSQNYIDACGFTHLVNEGGSTLFEGRIIGWWEQTDGSLNIWGRDTTGKSEKKYLFQKGMTKEIPGYWNEEINRKSRNHLIFVEGGLDAARLIANGIPAVALGGASISEESAKKIALQIQGFTHWIDRDEAGEKGAVSTIMKTAPYGIYSQVFSLADDDLKDADDAFRRYSAEEVLDLISEQSIGSGYFMATRLVNAINSGEAPWTILYERGRQVAGLLKGAAKSEYLYFLNQAGIHLEDPVAEALRAYATLLELGVKDPSSLVKSRFGVDVNVD